MKLSPEMEKRCLELAGLAPAAKGGKRKERAVVTGTPARWSFTLWPACRVVTEANTRGSWRAKARRFKAQREAVYVAWRRSPLCGAEGWAHVTALAVTLTHVGPKMDDDNLAGAFKAVRDEVAKLIGVDDGDDRVSWSYRQERGEMGIRITIENRP